MTVFETIWKYKDILENKDANACIMTLHVYETIFKTAMRKSLHVLTRGCKIGRSPPRNLENKDGDWCILMLFDTTS